MPGLAEIWFQGGLQEGLRGVQAMLRETILEILGSRFGQVTSTIGDRIKAIADTAVLTELRKKTLVVGSLEEFQGIIGVVCKWTPEECERWRQLWYETGVEEGRAKIVRRDISEILEYRFESIPSSIAEQIERIYDLTQLVGLREKAWLIPSLEEFGTLVDEIVAANLDR
ncbi:MAG: hypothetical protein HQK57_05180 [Deltaproteobacteria bacterium]|nr:hypothetical protein [Deltaproteobacteria bacterium]MBF0508303.1 hypothetical protein [Deltaproteobacteria bacterium]MBF0527503.1 hypothetical protein [Deltaproteobacteria bacterium]